MKLTFRKYLSHENPDDDAQLVESAKGPPQGGRRDLANVHGHKTCAEAAEEADNQSAQDQHFNRLGYFAEPHKAATSDSQQVDDEHRIAPERLNENTREISKIGPVSLLLSLSFHPSPALLCTFSFWSNFSFFCYQNISSWDNQDQRLCVHKIT